MLVVSGVRVTSSLIVSLTWISIRHRLLVVVVVVFFFVFLVLFCFFFMRFFVYILSKDIKTEIMFADINLFRARLSHLGQPAGRWLK